MDFGKTKLLLASVVLMRVSLIFFQKKEIKGGDFIAEIGDKFNDFELQLICEIRY